MPHGEQAKDDRHVAADSSRNTSNNSSASTGSILAGLALVGAAAGYAALAFRFRNFSMSSSGRDRFAAGSAEMRAAEAFTKEWMRQERTAASRGARGAAGGSQQSAGSSSRSRSQHPGNGDSGKRSPQDRLAWAMRELGLNPAHGALPTYADAKAAYRERAKAVHPDSGSAGADAEAFKRVSEAWDAVKSQLPRQ